MNNSDFTLNQIRQILPILLTGNEGILYSTTYDFEVSSSNLIEFDPNNNFFIENIIQEGTFLIIQFYSTSFYDELDSEKHYFKTLQEISTVQKYLDEL